jgi:hypothetical protein
VFDAEIENGTIDLASASTDARNSRLRCREDDSERKAKDDNRAETNEQNSYETKNKITTNHTESGRKHAIAERPMNVCMSL